MCVVARVAPVSKLDDGIDFVEFPRDFTRVGVLTRPDRVARFLRGLEADVYHFHDPDLLPVAGLMSSRDSIIIYDCHEWYQQVFPHKGYRPLLAKGAAIGLSLVERIVIPRLDAVIVPTEELARVYKTLAKTVVSIRNFAPVDGWTTCTESGEKTWDLIHTGTVSRPRLEVMLDIARSIRDTGRSIKFCLLGVSDEVRSWVNSDAKARSLVDCVGRVSETEVPGFLERSRIGINYHPYQQRFMVAIPMKVFEYMRHGLPFVSTALPPLKRLLGDSGTGLLVEENTVPSFVAAITSLLDDQVGTAQMGQRGRELITREYNWERESVKLVGLYRQLLGKRGLAVA
ncbi:MAG: glycosyltransferase [Firmicutes bacterium]|nr:glycosyltransferase [Bacillota bacterium]